MSDTDQFSDWTIEWMLLVSIMQHGVAGLLTAMRRGVQPRYFKEDSDERIVFEHLTTFTSKERLPNEFEIVASLGIEVPIIDTLLDLDCFIEAVTKQTMRQDILEGSRDIVRLAETNPALAREKIKALFDDTSVSEAETFSTADRSTMGGLMERYLKRKEDRAKGRTSGLMTPWPGWNDRCRGLQRGEITTVLALTGVGKTHLTVIQAVHTWKSLEPGQKVLFVSLETMQESLLDRVAAVSIGLDYQRFLDGTLKDEDEERLEKFIEESLAKPDCSLVFAGPGIKNVGDIESLTLEAKPELLIIDGIYLLNTANAGNEQRWERITKSIEELRRMAVRCKVPILMTCQFASGTAEDGEGAAKAKYATSVFDSSSVVLGLFGGSSEDAEIRTTRRLKCLKANEFAIPFSFRINFDMTNGDFSEIECYDD